jgi:hypothetical protein
MISLIEVQCPHCGVKGKIMVPSQGVILIGPCPQCDELVAVFCGQALPLEKEVMLNGSGRDRRDHLMEVLTAFLEQSIGETLDKGPLDGLEAEGGEMDAFGGEYPETYDETEAEPKISDEELDRFSKIDLPALDNKAYFDAIFNRK